MAIKLYPKDYSRTFSSYVAYVGEKGTEHCWKKKGDLMAIN